jgi:hypothetical protein
MLGWPRQRRPKPSWSSPPPRSVERDSVEVRSHGETRRGTMGRFRCQTARHREPPRLEVPLTVFGRTHTSQLNL